MQKKEAYEAQEEAIRIQEETLKNAKEISNDKKYASERENEEIDPETGLYLTGKKMTEEENMERINPSFDSDNKMFKINSECCTIAMELRERGYDVHAGTGERKMYQNEGVGIIEKETLWYTGEKPYKHTKSDRRDDYQYDEALWNAFPQKIKSNITKETNSRGEIVMSFLGGCDEWKSVYYKVDGKNKLTIYDTQSNKKLTNGEIDELFDNVDYFDYTRLDNSTPDIQYLKDNNYIC